MSLNQEAFEATQSKEAEKVSKAAQLETQDTAASNGASAHKNGVRAGGSAPKLNTYAIYPNHKGPRDKTIKHTKFGCPTLRYGVVCDAIEEDLDFDSAKLVRILLKKKWSNYFSSISENPTNFGLHELKRLEDAEFHEELGEGPIILFPEYEGVFLKDNRSYTAVIRSSITICVEPNHSKVWTRLCYKPSEDEPPLDANTVRSFLFGATFICKSLTPALKDLYKDALDEIGFPEPLKAIHEILIEVISTNRRFDKFLPDEDISQKEISNDGCLRACDLINDMGLFYDWMNKDYMDNFNMIYADQRSTSTKGIIFQYNTAQKSSFVCVINEGIKPFLKNFNKTKEFGKKLIRLIAISI